MSTAGGALHLIPVPLGDVDPHATLSASALVAAAGLDYFIVENEKSARRFIKSVGHPRRLQDLQFERFDKAGDPARAV
jgi:16S rRNA (cytidine1402-2'-O)-methyltransferase